MAAICLPIIPTDSEIESWGNSVGFDMCEVESDEELTIADRELKKMHVDAEIQKKKKSEKPRVSFGKTTVKEIKRIVDLCQGCPSTMFWYTYGDTQTARVEKRCEPFWLSHGSLFGWNINEKCWNRCSEIDEKCSTLNAQLSVGWVVARDPRGASVFKGGE